MTETTVCASRLALGDRIGDKTVVAVGFTDMTKTRVRVAYQTPYVPPDLYHELVCDPAESVQITREELL